MYGTSRFISSSAEADALGHVAAEPDGAGDDAQADAVHDFARQGEGAGDIVRGHEERAQQQAAGPAAAAPHPAPAPRLSTATVPMIGHRNGRGDGAA